VSRGRKTPVEPLAFAKLIFHRPKKSRTYYGVPCRPLGILETEFERAVPANILAAIKAVVGKGDRASARQAARFFVSVARVLDRNLHRTVPPEMDELYLGQLVVSDAASGVPEFTAVALRKKMASDYGRTVSLSWIRRLCKTHGINLKRGRPKRTN